MLPPLLRQLLRLYWLYEVVLLWPLLGPTIVLWLVLPADTIIASAASRSGLVKCKQRVMITELLFTRARPRCRS